jgi:DNA-directed RNA polymerase specialized sigma subunit
MRPNFFEGFEYNNVLKYVNKVARSLQGMLTDRSLEYEDLVGHGLMAATNAFVKWDTAHEGDRSDTSHLEAFVKTCISGNMKNMFIAAKRRNQLVDDASSNSEDDDDDVIVTAVEDYDFTEDDSDNINGKSQRKFAKVFHAGNDADSVAMMDVASAKVAEEEDDRLPALEAFIKTLTGIELDIMNNILSRTDDSIKAIAARYNVSPGCISRKCSNIKEAARVFISNY